jgi:MtN3 and saliva related transmembrane protein
MLEYLGYAAGVLTVVSFLPQVVRAWKTRQVSDLSFGMFALLITAGLLWIAYGVGSTDWPVIATNAGMVTLNGAILAARIRFRESAEAAR